MYISLSFTKNCDLEMFEYPRSDIRYCLYHVSHYINKIIAVKAKLTYDALHLTRFGL